MRGSLLIAEHCDPGLVLCRLGETIHAPSLTKTHALMDPETRLTRAGQDIDDSSGGAVPSLPQSVLSEFDGVDTSSGVADARSGAPVRRSLENTLADLDGGAGAVACATGMAAVSTVTSLFDAGAHLLCTRACSANTKRLFSHLAEQGKLSVSYEDLSDREALLDAVRPNTEALWVETPSNPLLRIFDLKALSDFADAHDLRLIVDNTLLSPLLQRPLDYGADLVVYSTMTHLTGHSDAVGGVVVAGSERVSDELNFLATTHGTVYPAVASRVALRGSKTLSVRGQQHETNARAIAYLLHEHPAVERVHYPGLRHHPNHKRARQQQEGYGRVVSFLVDEDRVDAEDLLRATEVFTPAESLGGMASIIEHPATMSHDSKSQKQREEAGITNNLLRLTIGIESTDDLKGDLEQALEAAQTTSSTPVHRQEPMSVRV